MTTYFTMFRSNSVGGVSNQYRTAIGNRQCGRVFYRITHGGTYRYSLLFADTTDSTFRGHPANRAVGNWTLHAAAVARVPADFFDTDFQSEAAANRPVSAFTPLTFGGCAEKAVEAGEQFACDPLTLSFDAGDYLCLQLTVSGEDVPCHPECVLPMYRQRPDGSWEYRCDFPAAVMIGCDRPVTAQIGFFGDSITQGIGPRYNSYRHWSALLADKLGSRYAYWNLGIGCGRASDAASDGAWLQKAQQCDTVFVCFGVNDLSAGFTAEQIVTNLTHVVDTLKADGKTVILQTVPPFDYTAERTAVWQAVNARLRTALADRVDLLFDCVPILGGDQPQHAKYGGHPNEEGSRLWADALYTKLLQAEVV